MRRLPAFFCLALLLLSAAACADGGRMTQGLAGRHMKAPASDVKRTYKGRTLYVHAPATLPPKGQRALVVVLHGGLGRALRIVSKNSESGMNLDAMADRHGFIVAYLNGTPVTRIFGKDKKGWNAGLCCGQAARNKIDDVGYITGAVAALVRTYGIDPKKVYGVGHSNGAMMTQRVVCEAGVYAAAVSISGALETFDTTCPGATGRRILEVHGEGDTAVPIKGGRGTGIDRGDEKRSQEASGKAFAAAGASYTLDIVRGARHKLDTIDAALRKTEGVSLPEKIVGFLGLDKN